MFGRLAARAMTTYGPVERSIVQGLAGRSLLRVDDYSVQELNAVLALSRHLKALHKGNNLVHPQDNMPLTGKSLAMIFQKRSTRTRVSTETGAALLGMHALFLGVEDIQLGVNESLRDTAIVLSRYNSLILARVFGHEVVQELATYSTVPVINALSNSHHPLQALADIMTLQEHVSTNLTGRTIAWIGDGNNVLNDLMLAGVMSGCNIRVATPPGIHEPSKQVVESALAICKKEGRGSVRLFNEPAEALQGADVVVTDTWVSMGQEAQKQARLKTFASFKVTMDLIKRGGANPNWKFMHCLPRHEFEVDDEVFYSPNSVVFDEAENRMYTVMAVMLTMLGKAGAV
jgi:ornithine carbamoyltransferase